MGFWIKKKICDKYVKIRPSRGGLEEERPLRIQLKAGHSYICMFLHNTSDLDTKLVCNSDSTCFFIVKVMFMFHIVNEFSGALFSLTAI